MKRLQRLLWKHFSKKICKNRENFMIVREICAEKPVKEVWLWKYTKERRSARGL